MRIKFEPHCSEGISREWSPRGAERLIGTFANNMANKARRDVGGVYDVRVFVLDLIVEALRAPEDVPRQSLHWRP